MKLYYLKLGVSTDTVIQWLKRNALKHKIRVSLKHKIPSVQFEMSYNSVVFITARSKTVTDKKSGRK